MCRAFLSPWYERGGIKPADENDKPVFEGRCNLGRLIMPSICVSKWQTDYKLLEVPNSLIYYNIIRNYKCECYESRKKQ